MLRYTLFIAVIFLFISCNNAGRNDNEEPRATKTATDSLMDEIMEGHDAGMAKYGKLKGLDKELQSALDSIAGLKGAIRDAAAPYKAKLDTAASQVREALQSMDKWMEAFNMDSALNNAEERLRYFKDEKIKVDRVRDAMIRSYQWTDSLLHSRK